MIIRLGVISLVVSMCVAQAHAIVIRDDRNEAAAQAFAFWLPQPLVVAETADGAVNGMGVKIGARFILTAAHVALQFAPGDKIGIGGEVSVREIHFASGEPSMQPDIAVIETDNAVRDGDRVVICAKSVEVGARIAIIGAGDVGDGRHGVTGPSGAMLAAENVVDKKFSGILSFLFDGPDDTAAIYLEGVSGPGDSGGPAFVLQDGGFCVAGVSSGQNTGENGELEGKYGAREFYVDAAAHRDWITAIPGMAEQ